MGPSVVIVDDNEGYRNSLRTFLESEGFEVLAEAVDGCSAIPLIVGLSPSLVLLDVRLPDISGFVVAARLRAAGCSCPVVLVSSRRVSASAVEAAPVAGFLPKEAISGEVLRQIVAAA